MNNLLRLILTASVLLGMTARVYSQEIEDPKLK